MQIKKIKTGVVYATHRSSEWSTDQGSPVVVLDIAVWEKSQRGGHRHARAGTKPSRGSGYSSYVHGLPAIEETRTSWRDVHPEQLATLTELAKTVTEQLAAHRDGEVFAPELPEGFRFHLAMPREIQAEWGAYVAERQKAAVERDAERERVYAGRRAQEQAEEAARARIAAILLDCPILQEYGAPRLTWPQLAELLDEYADRRASVVGEHH